MLGQKLRAAAADFALHVVSVLRGIVGIFTQTKIFGKEGQHVQLDLFGNLVRMATVVFFVCVWDTV